MRLITISGIDGSGKSTQIQLLKDYLESQGKRVFYFHAIDFSIANKILGKKKDSGGKEVSVEKAGWLKIFLRKIALRIDLVRFKSLLRSLLRNMLRNTYDYILSDRYFYDTTINIEYLSPKAQPSERFRRLSLRIPNPDLAIYLQADPEKIMQRERIPDQGLEYLKKKKELFDSSVEEYNFKIIDGNKDKEEVFEEIKSYV